MAAHVIDEVTICLPFSQWQYVDGIAYAADNGDVYYAVGSFPGYGKLSGKDPEELRAGARVEVTIEGVTHVTTQIGGGSPRFLLTYTPESNYRSFGRILVDVDDYKRIPGMVQGVQRDMEELFPQAIVQVRQFVLGPSTGGKIQLRISGPDPAVLRTLAAKAEAILTGMLEAAPVNVAPKIYQDQTIHLVTIPGVYMAASPCFAMVEDRLLAVTLAVERRRRHRHGSGRERCRPR